MNIEPRQRSLQEGGSPSTWRQRMRAAGQALAARWDHLMTAAALGLALAFLFPSAAGPTMGPMLPVARWVQWVEDQGRFVNTALQVAMPVLTRDIMGLKSLAWIALTGTGSTHGLKRALNDVEVKGVRLGQRPSSERTRHNFPSGHASLASSGAVFVATRYGWRWLLLLGPVVLATAYARVALDAHTWSAVVAGTCLGVLFTRPFCKR